jgi:hypothetical protein
MATKEAAIKEISGKLEDLDDSSHAPSHAHRHAHRYIHAHSQQKQEDINEKEENLQKRLEEASTKGIDTSELEKEQAQIDAERKELQDTFEEVGPVYST